MSVSQVKKRFAEFETYLGRDKEALRRLKLLKDDVNVLRTSLASAEEKAELAEVVKNAARERADKAEAEAEVLRLENQRLCAQLASMKASLEAFEKRRDGSKDNDDDDAENTETSDSRGLKKVVQWLRKSSDIPRCPKAFSGKLGNFIYDRDDLAKGWSYRSLYTLGAATAAIAAFNGQVTIRVDKSFRDYPAEEKTDGLVRAYLLWTDRLIDKSIDERSEAEKLKYDMSKALFGSDE